VEKKDQDSAKGTAEIEDSTASDIWKTLSAVNVNEHTESKTVGDRTLTYLSWAWAWTVMMEHYPQLSVKWHGMTDSDGVTRDLTTYPGGTASVCCSVRIGTMKREMWLPVMDYRNKAITNPDEKTQKMIREAVRGGKAEEAVKLTKLVTTMGEAALKLNGSEEEATDG
jgi:hypothetical protein